MNNFMNLALKQALKAYKKQEVPIGAIIVKNGKIISKAYNKKENKQITTKHAEIIAIERACKKLKTFNLNNCELYVTLEPCAMCREVIREARVENVYYLCDKTKNVVNKTHFIKLNSSANYLYSRLLTDFFDTLRK